MNINNNSSSNPTNNNKFLPEQKWNKLFANSKTQDYKKQEEQYKAICENLYENSMT